MTLTISRGNSTTAQYLDTTSREKQQYFSQSAALTKRSAYEELVNVWEECKEANWDGYNAFPVQEQTFEKTYSLIEALPLGYPLPSVGAEPDGHLTLEWYVRPQKTFSISISPEGILYYAGLFDDSDPRGVEVFGGRVHPTILDLIQRVFIA
jgi:hypothetical protein